MAGAVDDLVKVWLFKNDPLDLTHKLEGHSLGVVSDVINSDSRSVWKCKQKAVKISTFPWYW